MTAWPERLAAVRADPTDANLEALCNLLDAIDHWACEAYGKPAYADRVATLVVCRREAREANRLVTERTRAAQAHAGRVKAANRQRGALAT